MVEQNKIYKREAMGSSGERFLTQGELINREVWLKSLFVKESNIKKGDNNTRDIIGIKSQGKVFNQIK